MPRNRMLNHPPSTARVRDGYDTWYVTTGMGTNVLAEKIVDSLEKPPRQTGEDA